MKIQRFTIASVLACAIFLVVNGCGSSGTTNRPVPMDVYIAGTDGTNAVYWKNGVETVLSQNAGARAIAVSGSDVYVGGNTLDASLKFGNDSIATIWKNGVPTTLSNTLSAISAITVANGNVYAVGNNTDANYTTALATLWTNGKPTQLMDGMIPSTNYPNITYGNSVFVSGSDVYVAGSAEKNSQVAPNTYFDAHVAVYWKNGVPVDLSQVTNQGPNIDATSIAVSGSDVYVTGNIQAASPSNPQAVYWKNGTQVALSAGNFTGFGDTASSIAISGPNVYVSGGPDGHVQGYWVNGTFIPVMAPAAIETERTAQIAANGTDVYFVGSIQGTTNGNYVASYWKNGVPTKLTPTSKPSAAYGIALIPQQ